LVPVRHDGSQKSADELLARGNQKLGQRIHAFNLPAGTGCAGRSRGCSSCFAQRGRWLFLPVIHTLRRNLRAARSTLFARRIIKEARVRKVAIVRVHSSGDFYSQRYARKWLRIMRALPRVRFFFYSRSWRVSAIRPVLEEMATLPNVRVWFSADSDTGLPENIPPNVRIAWLLQEENEPVPQVAGIVFRIHQLRRTVQRRIGLVLVCPPENSVPGDKTDCGSCGVCWR
jgi:hypothetical protein